MKVRCAVLALLVVAIAMASLPVLAQEEETKVSVLWTKGFDELSSYMYNATDSKLYGVDTSKVQVLSDEIKDLAADDVQPCVVVSLDAPTVDINTNESIAYAVVLTNAYGTIVVGVADINATDSSVLNLSFFKIDPVSGDVAIVRTSSDIVVEANGIKFSIPLENYTDPKILIMTDGELYASAVNYIELRALTSPPGGFVLVRSGSGETVFTISASGSVEVWFDETHSPGDVDLFIYDSSDPDYTTASTSQSWSWHMAHATQHIFADAYPQIRSLDAHGSLKFVVKNFRPTASWRVAVRLVSSQPPPTPSPQPVEPQPSQPSQTVQPQTQAPAQLAAWWNSLQSAFGGNAAVVILVILIALIAIIAVLRR